MLKVANVMHSLVGARNVSAIRWLIVRSNSDPKVLLSRDSKGRTPRDLVRLGDGVGHRIHSMLLAAEDAAHLAKFAQTDSWKMMQARAALTDCMLMNDRLVEDDAGARCIN